MFLFLSKIYIIKKNNLIMEEKGWKPIPLSLKILFIFLLLWIVGSIMNLSNLYNNGMPFYGLFVQGITASIIAILLDIIGPILFLTGLWQRKSWAPLIAYTYMGIFSLNHIIAIFTAREQFGLIPILIPLIANMIFLITIYKKRNYFEALSEN